MLTGTVIPAFVLAFAVAAPASPLDGTKFAQATPDREKRGPGKPPARPQPPAARPAPQKPHSAPAAPARPAPPAARPAPPSARPAPPPPPAATRPAPAAPRSDRGRPAAQEHRAAPQRPATPPSSTQRPATPPASTQRPATPPPSTTTRPATPPPPSSARPPASPSAPNAHTPPAARPGTPPSRGTTTNQPTPAPDRARPGATPPAPPAATTTRPGTPPPPPASGRTPAAPGTPPAQGTTTNQPTPDRTRPGTTPPGVTPPAAGQPRGPGQPPGQATPGQPAPGQGTPGQRPAFTTQPGGGPRLNPTLARPGTFAPNQPIPDSARRPLPPPRARNGGIAPAVVGIAAGAGAVIGINALRDHRREVVEDGRTYIREPDRTIIRDSDGRFIVRHNEVDRFRYDARDVRIEREGRDTVTIIERPGGVRIINVLDDDGRLLRRTRRFPDGREIILIDNRYDPGYADNYYVDLPPPVVSIPRDRYIVEAAAAPPPVIYETLMAPPVQRIERRYTLDQIRYNQTVRELMPRIDLDTINFETGSWEITPDQIDKLSVIADGLKRALDANPAEMFLIEGHTDAVGNDVDNMSLSDRRAESVAVALTERFQIPAENLTTQGYGEQYLKVNTSGPERQNRRVTVRRITPLLNGGQAQAK
ncbi:MAG: OmpA family protein [Variibacter sp.]